MANLITFFRIVCALALLGCSTFSLWFYGFYLLGGLSDVLDGFVARHFGQETKLGAQLDTSADMVFVLIVLGKVISTFRLPMWVMVWGLLIVVFKGCNLVFGFVRFKRLVSEHTILNKICGLLVFAIPLSINLLSETLVGVLLLLTCIAATLAALQEGYYIYSGKEIS